MPYSDFSPEQQAAMDRSLQAEFNAYLYMLVSIAALVGSIALFCWAIWA
ncbi:hypothetical protein [Sphingobium cupriresistens]|uniref:Uncharacterized protein n=1 Tax=Sphingobium cupriresistens LL01 TaxID=1420583 RepID=A0A0J7XS61_9SPHN|nr:hypothetical protein [Sphingobium cupriresistens]KMS54706.1 hypothetical protein V473_15255 [Sphingobium cupriresistens LL01]